MGLYIYFIISIGLLLPILIFMTVVLISRKKYSNVSLSSKPDQKEALDKSVTLTIEENDDRTLTIMDEATMEISKIDESGSAHSKTLSQTETQGHKSLLEGDILNGKYRIERILGSGAQGSVYVCTNIQLGNKWAAKHFNGSLNEKEILVKLNHICLPKISDLFHDENGSYIIESYIEGQSLDNKLREKEYFSEDEVLEWMIQLSEALKYIHAQNILHMDIKPKNIIITDDSRAILIDFGIATHVNDKGKEKYKVYGYSPLFCSPEQKDKNLTIDERSDLYSLASTAFYILTKNPPKNEMNIYNYRKDVSKEFAMIIQTCLCENKEERYKSADELKRALENIKRLKQEKEKTRLRNKILVIATIPMLIASLTLSYFGYSKIQAEKLSTISVNLDFITLTEQQRSDVIIEQIYQDGSSRILEAELIEWTSDNEDIAKINNGVIIGVNPGTTQINGQYYNKIFTIDVEVDSGVLGVDVSLKYNLDYNTEIFAGTGIRDIIDGSIQEAALLEPTSIAVTSEGIVYTTDRFIRKIENGEVSTINTGYIQPHIIRSNHNDELYFVSKEFLNENDEYVIGLYKLVGDSFEELITFNVMSMEISDFKFDSQNNIWLVVTDYIYNTSVLLKVQSDISNYEVIYESEERLDGMAIDNMDDIYLSQPETAVIYKLNDDELDFFAGAKHEKDFVDGKLMRMYEPMALESDGENLYFIDNNIIRKIIIDNGVLIDAETLSGSIDKVEEAVLEGQSYEVSYYGGMNMDLCVIGGENIYIADNESNVIRIIEH